MMILNTIGCIILVYLLFQGAKKAKKNGSTLRIFSFFPCIFGNKCLILHDKVHDFAYENDDKDSEAEWAAIGATAT